MRISDRHLRPVEGLLPPSSSGRLRLRVRIDQESAPAVAGQVMLIGLINNLCRLTDLVDSVEVVGDEAPLRARVPYAAGSTLIAAAIAMARWAVGGEVGVVRGDGSGAVDLEIHLGAPQTHPRTCPVLVGIAAGWRAWVGTSDNAPSFLSSDDPNPLGPLMAASLLAGEVFKRGRGISGRGRLLDELGYSLWNGRWTADWDGLEDGPRLTGQTFPPFYLVGAGAVGQALVYCLVQTGLMGIMVVLDDDRHDRTNLNRCFLAGEQDAVGCRPKVEAVTRFAAGTPWTVHAFPQSLASYVGDFHPGLPQDLREAEEEGRYNIVVSCVDKGNSRQDIQGIAPRLVFGGSTEGLSAKAMTYDVGAGTACLACHNPPGRDGERVRILEQQVRALNREERALFLSGKVAPEHLGEVLDHLDAPQCGSAGESRFRAAAMDHGGAFSASFVSMGAGLLLASALLRKVLFADRTDRAMSANLAFLNGKSLDTAIAVDAACLKCGGARDVQRLTHLELANCNSRT